MSSVDLSGQEIDVERDRHLGENFGLVDRLSEAFRLTPMKGF